MHDSGDQFKLLFVISEDQHLMMTEARQSVHELSGIVHLYIVIGAAVYLLIFRTHHFSRFHSHGIPLRIESAKRHLIFFIFRKVHLQLSAEALSGKRP